MGHPKRGMNGNNSPIKPFSLSRNKKTQLSTIKYKLSINSIKLSKLFQKHTREFKKQKLSFMLIEKYD